MSTEEETETGPIVVPHAFRDYSRPEEDRHVLELMFHGLNLVLAHLFYPESADRYAIMHGFGHTPGYVDERNEARMINTGFDIPNNAQPVAPPSDLLQMEEDFLRGAVVVSAAQRLQINDQFGSASALPQQQDFAQNRAVEYADPALA